MGQIGPHGSLGGPLNRPKLFTESGFFWFFLVWRVMTVAGARTQTAHITQVMDVPAKVLSTCLFPVADLRWGADASTSPIAQNFLNFMQFFGNFDKIICWPHMIVGSPPTGSLGSAPGFSCGSSLSEQLLHNWYQPHELWSQLTIYASIRFDSVDM